MTLKNRCLYVLLFFSTISLSACFEVIEEINVHKNGSGNMTVTLNLSQSKTKLSSVMLLDSINGYKVPDKVQIQRNLNEAVAILKKTPGISSFKHRVDFENFIAFVSFSFEKVDNLNHLSKIIYEKLKIKPTGKSLYNFDTRTQLFSRNYTYAQEAKSAYMKLKEADKQVFKNASYTCIYRFDSVVKQSTNKQAKLSGTKKAVMLHTSILDLINGRANITNQIQLVNN
uniref:Lipoprotein n=1 Tax=Sphingobacterium sp. (strain 21) TaxID=743722 RepID=F4C1Q9_SPHS2